MAKNIAVIFAGGTGQRMGNQDCPKQFMTVYGKPIIIYTLEKYQQNARIHGIVIACLESWIDHCKQIVSEYRMDKVAAVVPGGTTGQKSIYNGLKKAAELYGEDNIVLVHDGVRPLIDQDTIDRAILCAESHGNAITVSPAVETVTLKNQNGLIETILDRSLCTLAKAPQCFRLKDILAAHRKAYQEGLDNFIDSAMLMSHYGAKLFTIEGNDENLKLTKQVDIQIFKAILDSSGKNEMETNE